MRNRSTASDTVRGNIKQLWRNFCFYAFGCFLLYSAFGTLLSLQSSINITDGLGTISSSVITATSVAFSLLFMPSLIRMYGMKKCLCVCELTYVVFIVANFHPKFYTLLPASVLLGIGECAYWSSILFMTDFFAKRHCEITSGLEGYAECDIGKTTSKFSGYFFAIMQCEKLMGSLISYGVLYGFRTDQNEIYPATNLTSILNVTENSTELRKYKFCGAEDCQNANLVKKYLKQYRPESDFTLYILFGALLLLSTAAIGIHSIFMPSTIEPSVSAPTITATSQRKDETTDFSLPENQAEGLELAALHRVRTEIGNSQMLLSEDNFWVLFTAIFKQLFEVRQLLISPILLNTGLQYAFVVSDLTRALSSCVVGVAWVPLHMLMHGLGSVVASFVFGKARKKRGLFFFVVVGAVMDVAVYSFVLFWSPNSNSAWSIFAVFFVFGAGKGIWNPLSNALENSFFPDRPHISGPVWNIVCSAGLTLSFGWSTSFCVKTKIYIQITVLFLGVATTAIAELLRKRDKTLDSIRSSRSNRTNKVFMDT